MSFGVDQARCRSTGGADEYVIGKHEIGSVNARASSRSLQASGTARASDPGKAEKMLHRMQNNRIIKSVVALSPHRIATGADDVTIKTWI